MLQYIYIWISIIVYQLLLFSQTKDLCYLEKLTKNVSQLLRVANQTQHYDNTDANALIFKKIMSHICMLLLNISTLPEYFISVFYIHINRNKHLSSDFGVISRKVVDIYVYLDVMFCFCNQYFSNYIEKRLLYMIIRAAFI